MTSSTINLHLLTSHRLGFKGESENDVQKLKTLLKNIKNKAQETTSELLTWKKHC